MIDYFFQGEPMFLDGDSDDDQHMNGGVKKVKVGKQNGTLFFFFTIVNPYLFVWSRTTQFQ